ncbi:MAG: inositol monophosphatase [Rhodospirillales bacterium]|nr:inositol monophosphatase [Rhodospirillales bacterium]
MRFTPADATALAALLRAAARAEILPRFRNLAPHAIRAKSGPLDLVTEADTAAEQAIAAGIAARWPGAPIVGEEAASADPTLVERLTGTGLSFVVDPVDGTFNFATGVPLFAVMAAALIDGHVAMAAIHDPLGDDTALALAGGGAWIEAPSGSRAPLRVAAPAAVAAMTGVVSWQFMPDPLRGRVLAGLPRLAATWNYRCAGHEYRLAASGGCHLLAYHRLLPWDHAPGWLIHAEAGDYSAAFDGAAYAPGRVSGGLLCAPDRVSWEAARAALLG